MNRDEMIEEMQRVAGSAKRGWQKTACERLGVATSTLEWSRANPDKPVPASIVAAIQAYRAGRRAAGDGAAFGAVDWKTLGRWSIVIPSTWSGDDEVTDVGVMCHAAPRFVLFAQARRGEKAGRVRYERLSGTREPDSATIAEGLDLLRKELDNAVNTRQEVAHMRDMRKSAKKKSAIGKGKEAISDWSKMSPSERIDAARSYERADIDAVRARLRDKRAAADERLRKAIDAKDLGEVAAAAEERGRLDAEQHIIASAAFADRIDTSDVAVRLLIKSTLAEIVADNAAKRGGRRTGGWTGDDPEGDRERGEAAWQAMIDEIKRDARARAPEIGSVASAARDLSKLPGLRPSAVATLRKIDEGMDELVYETSRDEISAAGGDEKVVEKWRKDISGKIDFALKNAGR